MPTEPQAAPTEQQVKDWALSLIQADIQKAVAAERERCAALTETYSCDHQDCLDGLAFEIRRGDPVNQPDAGEIEALAAQREKDARIAEETARTIGAGFGSSIHSACQMIAAAIRRGE